MKHILTAIKYNAWVIFPTECKLVVLLLAKIHLHCGQESCFNNQFSTSKHLSLQSYKIDQ